MPSRVALGQAEAVEKLVGEVGIVLRPLRLVLVLEERRFRQHRVVRRDRDPVEDRVVDVVAVDRDRQRAAEIGVAEQLAQTGSMTFRSGKSATRAPFVAEPAADLVAAPLLRLLQEGEVGEAEIGALQVRLAGGDLGRDQVGARDR